ncbi:hypothetical protein [Streptomyces mordarskii]|uniref:HIT domain-containing protein n=1 Tax=Streptomyces mordarskii TaxID=1226758 RepID=A0ABN1ET11_9ACTN
MAAAAELAGDFPAADIHTSHRPGAAAGEEHLHLHVIPCPVNDAPPSFGALPGLVGDEHRT